MNFVQPIRDKEKIENIKAKLREQSERNYILFLLGIYTGLRCSDLIKVKVKDIRNKEHLVLVEQKTGKQRRMKINPELKRELKQYIVGKDDDEYLIKSRQGKGKHLSRKMVYIILKKVAKAAGLDEIGTHTLRKTFGYHFYQKYKDVALLQDWFNHSSPAITLRYIGINQDMMDRAIDNFRI